MTTSPAPTIHRPTTPLGPEVIRTEQLTKVYAGDIVAVDALDLAVHQGEVFGLLGPNGAGKSTTAGMLTTRVIPTGGKAYVNGVDVVAQPSQARRLIGVVPQTNTLDRSLSVFENLYFHGRFFGLGAKASRTTATELIDRIKLNRFADAPVMALSGGMAQRLMLARAIMHRPAVLFLDEPTSGLDPQSRLALYDIIRELHAEGQTVLLTTHYMEEADALCERLAIIDHGRILALGTPTELKQMVGADTIVTIMASGDLDRLTDLLRSAVEGLHDATCIEGGVRLACAATPGLLPTIVTAADHGGFAVTDLTITEPTLETVFIDLTGKELRD